MSWHVYRMLLKAKSPIHIGWQRLGMIQRTYLYLPGRTLWGASTALLTKRLFSPAQNNHYKAVGELLLQKHILLSYFYPKFGDQLTLLPRLYRGHLYYDDVSKTEPTENDLDDYRVENLEQRLLSGSGHTALHPTQNSATEASLHQVEFLNPYFVDNDGELKPVKFEGYLFVKPGSYELLDGEKLDVEIDNQQIRLSWRGAEFSLSEIWNDFQLGGERRYGYGRLQLIQQHFQPVNPDQKLWNRYTCHQDGPRPQMEIQLNHPIPAHLRLPEEQKEQTRWTVEGDIEPLTGRIWEESKGAGRAMAKAELCYVPGSIVKGKKPLPLEVGPFGILQFKTDAPSHT